MAGFTDGLVSRDDAKRIYALRSKSVDEKTVAAANSEALLTKVKGEEQDGWTVAKRNKKSVRLTKPKPADRQLEDDIWSLLYRLGFKELNGDRNLIIKLGDNAPGRQLDIFAKDDETIFIVECTHARENHSKPVKGLIDKINGIREDVIKAIHQHYGRTPKRKVKWAIATRNVDWRKADKERAAEASIAVITEQDLSYYDKLTSYLKEAARYQFLARYLSGEGVEGLRIEVPAARGTMGGVTFYNFLISPSDLLKVSYISHKGTLANDLETYQRMVKPSRLKSIAAFIDSGGQFPTNIVINFKTKKSQLRFNKIQSFENTTFGTLTLPGQYGAAWIIDGQHRLYGYAFAKRTSGHVLPVLAYENLPASEEMRLFVDINCEQVKVPRSLLHEIYSNLNYGSEDPSERLEAQYSRIALRLDELPQSPVQNRVLTVSTDKDAYRCLTLTSLADGIKENKFLGAVVQSPPGMAVIQAGPMSHLSGDIELTTEKAADVLVGYLNAFAKGAPANWQLGDSKGGFLCTNNGLRALFKLLRELIVFIERTEHLDASSLESTELIEKVTPYADRLAAYFDKADPTEIQRFRSRQALDGVKKNCLGMMGILAESFPEFTNKELRDYIDTRDKEGTSSARQQIDEVNEILFNDVIKSLRNHFGETKEAWWWKGVPATTREKCLQQQNRDDGTKEVWQYLSLADYQTIVPSNWDVFEKRYDLYGKGNKTERVRWIGRLNSIRQTTHHPEKGLISKDDVATVREIHALVTQKILNGVASERS
jgi:DNA sulfur modification protein DndB